MTSKAKMRHCFYCGEELGVYADYDPLDVCGKIECQRGVAEEVRLQRAEAHEKLDRDRDW
jgi:hypothetical protein